MSNATTKDNANPVIHRRAAVGSGGGGGGGGASSSSGAGLPFSSSLNGSTTTSSSSFSAGGSSAAFGGKQGVTLYGLAGDDAQEEEEEGDDTGSWWRDEGVHVRRGGLLSGGRGAGKRGGRGGRARRDSGVDMDLDGDGNGGVQGVKGEPREEIDAEEVFDLIRSIHDPEHPLTLEELAVVNSSHITVTHPGDYPGAPLYPCVRLEFTPTIPHCSLATLIGLSLRVRLLQSLPPSYKVDISIRPGTHQSENAINKQLGDKERVAAALENEHLLGVVRGCLENAARRGRTEEEWERRVEELARELGVAV